jgi:hypothetical protein
MPLLITFRGRPVRRRRRIGKGLRLVLANTIPGEKSERLLVTQSEWDEHARNQFFPRDQMPDLRELARRALLLSEANPNLEIDQ